MTKVERQNTVPHGFNVRFDVYIPHCMAWLRGGTHGFNVRFHVYIPPLQGMVGGSFTWF